MDELKINFATKAESVKFDFKGKDSTVVITFYADSQSTQPIFPSIAVAGNSFPNWIQMAIGFWNDLQKTGRIR